MPLAPRPPQPDALAQALLQPIDQRLEKAFGAICLVIGVALVGLATWFLLKAWQNSALGIGVSTLLFVLVTLAAFFLRVGYRMAMNRPTSEGAVLSWRTFALLAVAFAGMGVTGLALAVVKRSLDVVEGSVCALLLALLCYGAAAHFERKVARAGTGI